MATTKDKIKISRQAVGLGLIVAAVALLVYDFFSPPVGELSNFALVIFAKITAIAGALLNIKIPKLEE